VSRPLDRMCELPVRGAIDKEAGEFWVTNPFKMPSEGKNLSAFENNRLFMNVNGTSFVDASYGSMANIDSDSRSVVTADFNRDGRPDLLVGSVGGGPLRLFYNQLNAENSGGMVRISLRGTHSNRAAVGSRIEAWINDKKIVRDVFHQNGCMGQGPSVPVFGLGRSEKIDRLRVRWPTGTWQEFGTVPANSEIQITEGESEIVVTPVVGSF